MFNKTLTSFEFFQQKKNLEQGVYEVIEHDDSVSVVILKNFGIEEWFTIEEYQERQLEIIEDLRWANDVLDLLYPEHQ